MMLIAGEYNGERRGFATKLGSVEAIPYWTTNPKVYGGYDSGYTSWEVEAVEEDADSLDVRSAAEGFTWSAVAILKSGGMMILADGPGVVTVHDQDEWTGHKHDISMGKAMSGYDFTL